MWRTKPSTLALRIPQLPANLPCLIVLWIELDGIADRVEGFGEPGLHTKCRGQINPGFRITGRSSHSQAEVLFRRSQISVAGCQITDLIMGERKGGINLDHLL